MIVKIEREKDNFIRSQMFILPLALLFVKDEVYRIVTIICELGDFEVYFYQNPNHVWHKYSDYNRIETCFEYVAELSKFKSTALVYLKIDQKEKDEIIAINTSKTLEFRKRAASSSNTQ